jgi:hypothetical protein
MTMPVTRIRGMIVGLALAALALAGPAAAQDVGQLKVVTGTVHIERGGQQLPATVGTRVRASDVIVTGADGTAGITFLDDSLLSVGPDSVLAVDRFAFDPTTHQGAFDSSLRKGTLSAVSGKIAKQSPDAMKVRTPAAILGVRGTEFVVRTTPSD